MIGELPDYYQAEDIGRKVYELYKKDFELLSYPGEVGR
jgi:hypothetical protein